MQPVAVCLLFIDKLLKLVGTKTIQVRRWIEVLNKDSEEAEVLAELAQHEASPGPVNDAMEPIVATLNFGLLERKH